MSFRQTIESASGYRWYALGLLTLVFTSSHVDRQIMGMLLQPIKLELGATDTQMGFLVGLTFALFYATLGMPIAMIADRSNRRNIITGALVVWSGMTALCGFAANFVQLALARIGVGIGEAGSTPPSHSLIADLFPQETRGTAMGIFALGVNFGLLIAYLGGGVLSEMWGWRATFIAVGLPGLIIAVWFFFTVGEPLRGASEALKPKIEGAPPSFRETWRYMWRVRAMRHTCAGAALAGFTGYGFVLWMPTFLQRSYDMSPSETGYTLALMSGVVGGIGTFVAGKLVDVLAKRDERWRAWVVAVGKAIYVPFLVAFFMMDDFKWAMLVYLVPAFFGGFYLAPTFALIQGLADVRMRAVASSITLFILNIVGMGFGPQLVGIVSDLFAPAYGNESLRMSLLLLGVVNFWCAWHYWLAGRYLHEAPAQRTALAQAS
ncbi:MAG: MFS transporter [Gammaproteobacteria bacterium]|nr:MFS transporter [Gammaproteobacteria bacterium]